MYDCLLKFATEAAATAALPAFTTDGLAWNRANVIPGVTVWQASLNPVSGLIGAVTTLVLLSGYFCWIALPAVPQPQTEMVQVQLCYDRAALNARQPRSLYRCALSFQLLDDIRVSPVYHGADVPWGQLTAYL